MCLPCFTDRRRKSQRNEQSGAHQSGQAVPLTRLSRNNARPPSRRGNNTAAQPPARTPHRQPTVSRVSPDHEQETDIASSQAFSNTPTSGISSPSARRQQGRSVSGTHSLSTRARSAGPNLMTFSEEGEEPEDGERIPLRGDLRGLPSLRGQHRVEGQRNQYHGNEHQAGQRSASSSAGLRFGHPAGTPDPHPGTLVPGSLTAPAAPLAQPAPSSSAPAAPVLEPKFSSSSDSNGTEVPDAATELPTASSSVPQQTGSRYHRSSSISSGEEEDPVPSALSSSSDPAAEPEYGTKTHYNS